MQARRLSADPGWFGLYALPGFLGSMLIAVGALGVGWFPLSADILQWKFIDFVQTETIGLALTRSFVVVGAALILQVWLLVGVDALHGKILRIETIYFSLVAWIIPLIAAPPLFSRDVYSYFMQGQMQLAGNNPYESGVSVVPGWFQSGVDPLWGDSPTPYGPVFLLIEKAIAAISQDSALAGSYLFRLISIVGVVLICLSIPYLAKAHGINPVSAAWIGVMNPLVLMHFVAGSHNDALMVGLVCVAMMIALRGHFVFGVIVATLALGIKPVAIVLLPFLALIAAGSGASFARRAKYALIAGFIALSTLFLSSAIAGTGAFGWIGSLSTPGTVKSWLSPMTAIGMLFGHLLQLLGFGNVVDTSMEISRLVGSLLLAIALVLLVIRPAGRSATRGVALSFVALVVLGPVVQPWYLLWSIPLLAVTGLSHKQLRIMVLAIAAFTVHGIANSSATADTFLELSDGIAMILAGLTLGLAMLASTAERSLILGDKTEQEMMPSTSSEIASARVTELV